MKLGDMLSLLGICLFALGSVYWLLYASRRSVFARLHVDNPVHLLGHLNIVGLLLIVLGRAMAKGE